MPTLRQLLSILEIGNRFTTQVRSSFKKMPPLDLASKTSDIPATQYWNTKRKTKQLESESECCEQQLKDRELNSENHVIHVCCSFHSMLLPSILKQIDENSNIFFSFSVKCRRRRSILINILKI